MNIFCNHCYGAELYKKLEIQYSTPLIWSLMLPRDYFIFISNLELYINIEPILIKNISEIDDLPNFDLVQEKQKIYPGYSVIKIKNIYIHFLHHKGNDVISKFNIRKNRFIHNKHCSIFLFVKNKYSKKEDVSNFNNIAAQHKFLIEELDAKHWNYNKIIKDIKNLLK